MSVIDKILQMKCGHLMNGSLLSDRNLLILFRVWRTVTYCSCTNILHTAKSVIRIFLEMYDTSYSIIESPSRNIWSFSAYLWTTITNKFSSSDQWDDEKTKRTCTIICFTTGADLRIFVEVYKRTRQVNITLRDPRFVIKHVSCKTKINSRQISVDTHHMEQYLFDVHRLMCHNEKDVRNSWDNFNAADIQS